MHQVHTWLSVLAADLLVTETEHNLDCVKEDLYQLKGM